MKYQAFLGGFHPSEQLISLQKFVKDLGYYPLSIMMPGDLPKSAGNAKNFCIIEFSCFEELKSFLRTQNFYFKGRCLHAKPFFKGKSLKKEKLKNKDFKFFLKNIPLRWDHNDLFRFLSYKVGGVEEACVITEPFSGHSKCIGYVIFHKSCEEQLKKLKGSRKLLIDAQFGFLEIDAYGAGRKNASQPNHQFSDSQNSTEDSSPRYKVQKPKPAINKKVSLSILSFSLPSQSSSES